MSSRIKTRTSKLRKLTALDPLIRVIVEVETSQIKLQASAKRVLGLIAEASKVNIPTLQLLAIILLSSKKTRSKVIKTEVRSNITLITRKTITSISALTKNQQTSIGFGNLYINNYS